MKILKILLLNNDWLQLKILDKKIKDENLKVQINSSKGLNKLLYHFAYLDLILFLVYIVGLCIYYKHFHLRILLEHFSIFLIYLGEIIKRYTLLLETITSFDPLVTGFRTTL